ncbi:hypothetical protein HWV07_18900 [Natronomonas salina]|uniref:hypothetical protein n=1 Tax=Natronomonas salina TaxID=1710540 RepID=UPI0015B4C89F|nr:hypothetical protein [Natronomonas salina]QLD91003.1 hypothetical protein HWV07_18900 [Natronomonas salina]
MADDDTPTFAIPEPPVRRYPRRGGVEYEGQTVFSLTPADPLDDPELASLVRSVLEGDPYRYGDWFDLPMPLYLVHDDVTGDTFRVAVRDGDVEFHVLPDTEPEGLRRLYDRLVDASETTWYVDRR